MPETQASGDFKYVIVGGKYVELKEALLSAIGVTLEGGVRLNLECGGGRHGVLETLG